MRTAPLHARPIEVLMVAAWFGMLTGFCEVLLRGIARFLLHRYIHLGPSVVWMAPLADLLLFAALGLLLLLLARRWPRVASLPSVLFVFVFIGSISLLLLVAGLHRAGAVLLSAGLATQASRLLAARAASFLSLVRHTAAWMVVLLGGLAIGIQGWQALGERFALANLPAASSGAPNVLLIVLDTVRAPSLSLYGYERPTTPELERLAARGVRFERALSTSPWTLPSHASMFTGHFPHELSADWETSLDETYPTLAEVLASQGYVTAGFVANVRYCSEESGLNRGFAHYEDHPVSPEQVIKSSSLGRALIANAHLRRFLGSYDIFGRKSAPDVNAAFLRWLSRNERRPFFAFLNYFDAHAPYLPPVPFDSLFASDQGRRRPQFEPERKWSPEEIRAERDAYDGAIAYLDHQLGLLFGELEQRGLLGRTLVIVTSDHGEEFGEHRLMSHGNSLYWPSLHVPLLISFPAQVPPRARVVEPVSLRDLPATVEDLVLPEGSARLPGISLARYWKDRGDPRDEEPDPLLAEVSFAPGLPKWFPVSKGDMRSLVVPPHHYILNGDGREELYDILSDPWETRDLAGSVNGRRLIGRFRKLLGSMGPRNDLSHRLLPRPEESDVRRNAGRSSGHAG